MQSTRDCARRRRRRSAFAAAIALLLGACSTIDEHTPPPLDWPALTVDVARVAHGEMRETCGRFTSVMASPEGCALLDFSARTCSIVLSRDFPSQAVERHEYLHCAGFDHPGESTLADLWRNYKAAALGRATAAALQGR